jgi:hypothetical protein
MTDWQPTPLGEVLSRSDEIAAIQRRARVQGEAFRPRWPAIVLAAGRATVGIGAGQMSRVDAVDIACRKAGPRARGSVMASDAFFPFRDGIDLAAGAGVTAVIHPGGSVRDH